MRITLIGMPGPYGGASVERGHTALLWRKMGLDVDVVPTVAEKYRNPWPARLVDAGCRIIADPEYLTTARDLLCVAFCCEGAVESWPTVRERGGRLVWASCMNMPMRYERRVFGTCPPTAVMFQSDYQESQLRVACAEWGISRIAKIRGAFEIGDFPFRPQPISCEMVVGKMARAAKTKWPVNLWSSLATVRQAGVPLAALCQAWTPVLSALFGKPPAWATCYGEAELDAREFIDRCHVLHCAGQYDCENWPRVGLEAMASGVSLVVDAKGGWTEMVDPSCAHLVADPLGTSVGLESALIDLYQNPDKRMAMLESARKRVERLADPEIMAGQWTSLLGSVA